MAGVFLPTLRPLTPLQVLILWQFLTMASVTLNQRHICLVGCDAFSYQVYIYIARQVIWMIAGLIADIPWHSGRTHNHTHVSQFLELETIVTCTIWHNCLRLLNLELVSNVISWKIYYRHHKPFPHVNFLRLFKRICLLV